MSDKTPSIMAATANMEYYARAQKHKLPAEQQAMIDAILLAEEIKKNTWPPRIMVAKLRGAAMQYRPIGCVAIAAFMDSVADQIEGKPIIKH